MKSKSIIYVIDDNAMLLELIANKLKNQGDYEVILFRNADNVWKYWNKKKPDLIILDYQFGDQGVVYHNGLQFLKSLRQISKVPVVALSGQKEKNVMANIINQGANDYIPKDETDFLEALMHSVESCLQYTHTKNEMYSHLYDVNVRVVITLLILALIFSSISL